MNTDDRNFEIASRFVIKLGTLAHRYGTQARRLESYLSRVTRTLGYDGVFSSTPTEILFTFKKKDDLWYKTHLIKMPGTGFNLYKLAKVGGLVSGLESGEITLSEAKDRLDEVDNMPPVCCKRLTALGYALSGAGFAGFLKCGIIDIILAAVMSVVVYVIILYTDKYSERLEHWIPFLCTFITGIIVSLISLLLPEIQVYLITLSAVIYLIPGFTISVGIMELSYKYVQSGIINIVNGLVYLALLFAGAWVGITMIRSFFPVQFVSITSVSTNFIWLSAMIMAVGLCIIFQLPKRDFLWAVAGSGIACIGIVLGEAVLDIDAGNFLGTVFAVIFANIWSTKTNRPASLVLLPSIVFLVSGSIGFRGFVALSAHNTSTGYQELFHMFVVAITLAVGLILGNTIYKAKISL